MTKPLLLLAAPVLLLVLPACPPQQCVSSIPPPSAQPGLFLVDEPVKLPLQPLLDNFCSQEGTGPTSLFAEILDPDHQPLETQTRVSADPPNMGVVEFTPRKPGRYHLFAAFEPMGGIHQFSFYTAEDRSAAAPAQTVPRPCDSLERTRSGALVCNRDVYRHGVAVRQFPSGSLAVAGDVLWRVTPEDITRYVDTGDAIEPAGVLTLATSQPEAMLVTETELVMLHGNKLLRIVFDGQRLTRTGESLWEPSFETLTAGGPRGIMLRVGDRLAVLSSMPSTGGFQMQACPFQLEQGRFVRTREGCEQVPGMLAGFEPSVLWVGEQAPGSFVPQAVRRLEWTGTQWLERGRVELGVVLRLPPNVNYRRSSVVPVLESQSFVLFGASRHTVPVYQPGQVQLRLEIFDKDAGNPQASSSLYWGEPRSIGGPTGTHVRLRPSTP